MNRVETLYQEQARQFEKWELIKDVVDQLIDLMLNYRQSGHPGGSRSKVHAMLVTLLSGVMRWDIREPWKRFGDRFVLVAGHTAPLFYAVFATLNESLRVLAEKSGDSKYLVKGGRDRTLTWEDLLVLRHRGGLPGHVEMAGKALFIKFNTGPSGHGSPPAAGQALALKRAGAEGVKVFALEGEGGMTAGAIHETKNSAYGLGLDNLFYVLDWNDFGIDDQPISTVIHGTPLDWFEPYGWHVHEAKDGSAWPDVTRAILEMVRGDHPKGRPGITYCKTRKGRGYIVMDNKSHGTPHKLNSEVFWETKRPFAEKYGVDFDGFGRPAPEDPDALMKQAAHNFNLVLDVLRRDEATVTYLASRLVELGESVPEEIPQFRWDVTKNPFADKALYDYENYPAAMWMKPGEKAPNRAALSAWGSWVNAWCAKHYGRPLFIAMSADLAASTNIDGFAKGFDDFKGWGVYEREKNPEGALLPQEITEFTNSGICVGLATVNFAREPEKEFNGFCSTCSTYGSFVYLKYGPMRLFSQLTQDTELKCGKVLWVAGHSGPETAEDSRTHFGIFAPGVTQLFPEGQIVDVHPWEYNEVPVVIAAGMKHPAPIIALHLTRPPVTIPDRDAIGMASHFEAAKGAYLIRDYKSGQKRMGTIFVQGTMSTYNLLRALPEIEKAGLNVKLVAAISPQLFAAQPEDYRKRIVSESDWIDSTVITNRSLRLMSDWLPHKIAEEYAMSSDWDNRWRTGGSVDEVMEEAHLSPDWILKGIERFVSDRDIRLSRLVSALDAARSQ